MLIRCLILICSFLAGSALAQVSVQVPDIPLQQGRAFEMVVTIDRPLENQALRLESLSPQFKLLDSKHAQLSQFRNGQSYVVTQWTLSLAALTTGRLRIPPLPVGGEFSPGQVLLIGPPPAPPLPEPVIVEAELEAPEVYVTSPLKMRVKLLYRVALASGARLKEPELTNARLIRLAQPRLGQVERDGLSYRTLEQEYLVIPQRAGRLEIPPVRLSGQQLDEAGQATPLALASNRLELEVLPPPEDHRDQWIPAQTLSIEEQWDQVSEPLLAGDTLTRTITLSGSGIAATALPALSLTQRDGYKVFEEQQERQETFTGDGVTSESVQSFRYLLTRHGSLEVPKQVVRWWNLSRNRWEEVTLPARTLQVSPYEAAPAPEQLDSKLKTSATGATEQSEETPSLADSGHAASGLPLLAWFWAAIAIACAVGWTQTAGKLRQARNEQARLANELKQVKQAAQRPQLDRNAEKFAYQALARSCHHSDPRPIADGLIEWSRAFWPQAQINTLADVRRTAQDPTLDYLIRNLEHRLEYDGQDDEPWTGDILISQLRKIRLRHAESQGH